MGSAILHRIPEIQAKTGVYIKLTNHQEEHIRWHGSELLRDDIPVHIRYPTNTSQISLMPTKGSPIPKPTYTLLEHIRMRKGRLEKRRTR